MYHPPAPSGAEQYTEPVTLGQFIKPTSAKEFFAEQSVTYLMFGFGKQLRVLGHTRYSTSDLKFNQPLVKGTTAMVMNGVLSQEGPETWPRCKAHTYETRNDTEIALNFALEGKRGDVNGSYAICELNLTELLCYRNGFRPLWLGKGDDYQVVASTYDALARCGVHVVRMLKPEWVVDLVADKFMHPDRSEMVPINDLQSERPIYENLKSSI